MNPVVDIWKCKFHLRISIIRFVLVPQRRFITHLVFGVGILLLRDFLYKHRIEW